MESAACTFCRTCGAVPPSSSLPGLPPAPPGFRADAAAEMLVSAMTMIRTGPFPEVRVGTAVTDSNTRGHEGITWIEFRDISCQGRVKFVVDQR